MIIYIRFSPQNRLTHGRFSFQRRMGSQTLKSFTLPGLCGNGVLEGLLWGDGFIFNCHSYQDHGFDKDHGYDKDHDNHYDHDHYFHNDHYHSSLLLSLSLPVVPHKAVAEVSKINSKPIGEVRCCESRMAERSH